MDTKILIMSIIVVFGEGIFISGIFYYYRLATKIKTKRTSRIGDIIEGEHKVKGKIIAFENKITAPLSNMPCVYYEFKMFEQRLFSPGNKEIINETKNISFGIKDGTGTAIINFDNPLLDINISRIFMSNLFKKNHKKLDVIFNKYWGNSKDLLSWGKIFCTEKCLKENEDIILLGKITNNVDGELVIGNGEEPLMISNKTESGIIIGNKIKSFGCLFGSLGIIVLLYLWKEGIISFFFF